MPSSQGWETSRNPIIPSHFFISFRLFFILSAQMLKCGRLYTGLSELLRHHTNSILTTFFALFYLILFPVPLFCFCFGYGAVNLDLHNVCLIYIGISVCISILYSYFCSTGTFLKMSFQSVLLLIERTSTFSIRCLDIYSLLVHHRNQLQVRQADHRWRGGAQRLHPSAHCWPHRQVLLTTKQDKNIKNLMNPILGLTVERPDSVEMSAWGVASLAGIQVNSFSI